jgi:hypothetical protein
MVYDTRDMEAAKGHDGLVNGHLREYGLGMVTGVQGVRDTGLYSMYDMA